MKLIQIIAKRIIIINVVSKGGHSQTRNLHGIYKNTIEWVS